MYKSTTTSNTNIFRNIFTKTFNVVLYVHLCEHIDKCWHRPLALRAKTSLRKTMLINVFADVFVQGVRERC